MSNQDKFQLALKFTLKWEGGYSDHPADLGGKTNYGITKETFRRWNIRKAKFDKRIDLITKEEAEQIYKEDYWDAVCCDLFITPLAIAIFDTVVNFGVGGGWEFVKDVVGDLSPQEVAENHNTLDLAIAICKGRIAYRHHRVKKNSSQKVFLEGWLNRDNDLLEHILNMNTTMPVLRIEADTWLKIKPLDSARLSEREKLQIKLGDRFPVADICEERKHYKIKLAEPEIGCHLWYYIYKGHARIENPTPKPSQEKKPRYEPRVKLTVPYLSQLDNWYNPTGACNVTSYAMIMKFFGIKGNGQYKQLEDELYQYMESRGLSRHSPYDLAKMGRNYGLDVNFTEKSEIEEVCQWISDEKKPVVIHGFFTAFGHIIVVVGYDENGFIVHDPYGEWFATGYNTSLSGSYLHYSYGLIRRLCIPDGDFWVHFISG